MIPGSIGDPSPAAQDDRLKSSSAGEPGSPQRFFHLRQPIRAFENLAWFRSVCRAYDAFSFHQVYQVRGAAVADAQAALQQGSGRLAEVQHQANRIFEELVVLGLAVGIIAARLSAVAVFFDGLQELLFVLRGALRAP